MLCAVTMSTLPPPTAATPGVAAAWQFEFMQVVSAIGAVPLVCPAPVVKLILSWQPPQAAAVATVAKLPASGVLVVSAVLWQVVQLRVSCGQTTLLKLLTEPP